MNTPKKNLNKLPINYQLDLSLDTPNEDSIFLNNEKEDNFLSVDFYQSRLSLPSGNYKPISKSINYYYYDRKINE